MRVLLDNCGDRRFARLLSDLEVRHAREMGWAELQNGKLIARAETEGFDAMITVDKNLRYQQNLSGRKLSIVTLNSRKITLPHLTPLAPKVRIVLLNLPPGSFVTVEPDRD